VKTYVEQKSGIYRPIRNLFIIGLVGFILAASGVIWLLVESVPYTAQQAALRVQQIALLPQQAILYNGSWVNTTNPNDNLDFFISKIEINSNKLNMTVHIFGYCGYVIYLNNITVNPACDMGTRSQTFTGNPLTIYIAFSDSDGVRYDWPLQLTLNNGNTQIQALLNNTYTGFFKKT